MYTFPVAQRRIRRLTTPTYEVVSLEANKRGLEGAPQVLQVVGRRPLYTYDVHVYTKR